MSHNAKELHYTPSRLMEISPVKKEKIIKQMKKEQREKLRADLPVLNATEIRRFRLPYHEALLTELAEGGYENTVEFVQQLFHYQEKNRRKYGPGTTLWLKPQLVYSTKHLDILTGGLMKAEDAHKACDFATEWEELLHLAALYAFGSDDWWWLGEQLLYQCVSMEYSGDFKKQETMANYIIGKYLVENGKKLDSGIYYLELARTMSVGKSWNCKKILKLDQECVFTESCKLLFKVYIEQARTLIETDPAKTIEISIMARKRAVEACNKNGEFETLILKAKAELKLNEPTEAIATVSKALNKSIRQKDIAGICEASISLALAYLQYGKAKESLDCLHEVKRLGEENNLPFYVAQAYRFMGEFYLNQKMPFKATPLLMLAFYIFHETGDLKRKEKVRTWAAISAGEELFRSYIRLIRRCDSRDSIQSQQALIRLIEWLDERKFFWTQESKFSFSYSSLKQSVFEIEDRHRESTFSILQDKV